MKTPKEILLQKHAGMESRLNAVRHRALAECQPRGAWWKIFRWHLTGLSAVWGVILLLNLNSEPSASVTEARLAAPLPRTALAAFNLQAWDGWDVEETNSPVPKSLNKSTRHSELACKEEIV